LDFLGEIGRGFSRSEEDHMDEIKDRELTPADFLAMLRKRLVLILILAVTGAVLAYGVSKFLPNRYKSQTIVLVQPPNVPSTIVPNMETIGINQRLATMQEEILSRTRLEPIIHQFGLFAKEINSESMDDLVAKLQKAIKVTPVEPMAETGPQGLPGFTVSVTLDNPRTAQAVCTAITSMFIERSISVQTLHAEQTTNFLNQQLADAKANLDAQDTKLASFQGRYMGSLPDDAQTNFHILTDLTAQLDGTNQALARAQQDRNFAESLLTQQLQEWQASQSGNNPASLEQQLATLKTHLADLQVRYTDDYPDVIKAKADIAALQKRLDESDSKPASPSGKTHRPSAEPAQITQWREQIHAEDETITEKTKEQEEIKRQIKQYEGRVQSSPAIEQQYKQLTRGYQTALDSYNDLLKKRDASAMSGDLNREQQGEQFSVLDPANLPESPSFPNHPLFALGGFGGGLALGVGLAFLIATQDKSLRNERDIEFALRLPVLAVVPAIEPISGKNGRSLTSGSGSGTTIDLRA
jgi:polysaccharide chain length determinant protein (PEP-CTERM system associated)